MGTQKSCLNEMVLFSTQNKCYNWRKNKYSQFWYSYIGRLAPFVKLNYVFFSLISQSNDGWVCSKGWKKRQLWWENNVWIISLGQNILIKSMNIRQGASLLYRLCFFHYYYQNHCTLLSCLPRVTVTSCFVDKVIRDFLWIDHLCSNPICRIGLIHKWSIGSC